MDWQSPHILDDSLDWPEKHAWIIDQKPHYQKLIQDLGDCIVSVSDKKQEKSSLRFKEAIGLVRDSQYYLKDFHFYKEIPEYMRYKIPKALQDDFLNEYFDHLGLDDYRFLYLGSSGTFTPMHHDVLKSFSWSFNLTGSKKWTFVSPDQEILLKDKLGNTLENIYDYDQCQFKDAGKIVVLELFQRPGEIMFVPSGWYHQVVNFGETLSINHNWINSHNLLAVFQYLDAVFWEIMELVKEHSEMEDFKGHCQKILKANCGMNIEDFLDMIEISIEIRISRYSLQSNQEDFESLKCFLQVLDKCASSLMACSSLQKIQTLKNSVCKLLPEIDFTL